jgi:hypothetical protein
MRKSIFQNYHFLKVYAFNLALSTKAYYKNYMLRVLQYKDLLEKNIENHPSVNEFYIQNLKRDRIVLLNKVEKFVKINRSNFNNEFDEKLEVIMDEFNVIEENTLYRNFSYNIAHIPEYEAYAV